MSRQILNHRTSRSRSFWRFSGALALATAGLLAAGCGPSGDDAPTGDHADLLGAGTAEQSVVVTPVEDTGADTDATSDVANPDPTELFQ
jgi:hypothetical protein